ncbi:S-adenosylmethionine-dependent methyltransferase Rv2258c-like [Babylonia areolata]|uniref:S-adenosylmethionine-dependent methyltransferase Rv2258c-like n=1 Tax=Babylonia areolata TaxID=304850 RepID=UPI003FD1E747
MAANEGIPDEKAYAQLAGGVFTGGCVSMAMMMAMETGLVKALLEASQPLSSQQLADQTRLKERYVRELLSSLAALKLIQLEEGGGASDDHSRYLFFLPAHHRHTFRKTAAWTTLVSIARSRFPRLRSLLHLDSPDQGLAYDDEFFCGLDILDDFTKDYIAEAILKTPGLKEKMESGLRALEIGCGPGIVSCHLAAQFPNSHFLLTDVSPEGAEHARRTIQRLGLTNVSVEVMDIYHIPPDWADRYDWIFALDVIHDLPYPLKALQEVRRMLKPGGQFSMVDIFMSSNLSENVGNPVAASLYAISTFMCIPESYQKVDSHALGACWGEQQALRLVKEAGMEVLDMTDTMPDSPGVMALCMCQKPA